MLQPLLVSIRRGRRLFGQAYSYKILAIAPTRHAAPCTIVLFYIRNPFATTQAMLTPVGNSSNSPVYRVHGSRFRKVEDAVAEAVAKLCSWKIATCTARSTARGEKAKGRNGRTSVSEGRVCLPGRRKQTHVNTSLTTSLLRMIALSLKHPVASPKAEQSGQPLRCRAMPTTPTRVSSGFCKTGKTGTCATEAV